MRPAGSTRSERAGAAPSAPPSTTGAPTGRWTSPGERFPPGAVLVLDGIFLHRDELRAYWDFSVYLDVDFDVSTSRLVARDGPPADPASRRYRDGQRLYLAACAPRRRATVVVDNTDLAAPRLLGPAR
jgi:uridine kinase